MPDRQQHQQEVQAFLRECFTSQPWELDLPQGSGNETYFAHCGGQACFVKLGMQAVRYQIMASIGLTPPVLAAGFLEDGTSIIVQPYIAGRKPSPRDFQIHLDTFAAAVHRAHHCELLQQVLPKVSSNYSTAGLQALAHIQQKWERCRSQVPKDVAGFVDESLADLKQQVTAFQGANLVASHNDICNANWLILPDGQVYLVDLESMRMDDPALDIGALLWWYYPPELRDQFLTITGHANEAGFEKRMQARMALHCLNILLPREHSFDAFAPASFAEDLVDFRAVLAGRENPQGYAG